MKTLMFSCVALLTSMAAHAADSTIYSCVPGSQPNGLGIKKLVLDVSNEDPEATMTLTYQNGGQPVVSNMATEDSGTRIELIPNSRRDGDLSVILVKKSGKWTANVKSATIDTFSVLDCQAK